MYKLYIATHLPEAHLIVGMLANAGIEAQILNQYSQSALGEIPFGETYPELWLTDAADMAAARNIIAAYERPMGAVKNAPCPDCGEDNPTDFGLCWNCGASL